MKREVCIMIFEMYRNYPGNHIVIVNGSSAVAGLASGWLFGSSLLEDFVCPILDWIKPEILETSQIMSQDFKGLKQNFLRKNVGAYWKIIDKDGKKVKVLSYDLIENNLKIYKVQYLRRSKLVIAYLPTAAPSPKNEKKEADHKAREKRKNQTEIYQRCKENMDTKRVCTMEEKELLVNNRDEFANLFSFGHKLNDDVPTWVHLISLLVGMFIGSAIMLGIFAMIPIHI